MRLRLRVRRNELPTISVVWPVDDLNSRQTISQFLQAVSERIPLDCDSWGLEDYAVTIADYEVFHYDILSAVCKDEDEVVIRPLSFAEVRARTLSGRAQITPDGRHLVDGVAFGRPLLKRPARPEVTIPPRTRQRVDDYGVAAGEHHEVVPFAETLGEHEEDSEEDEDFELDESELDEEEEDVSEEEQEDMIEYKDRDQNRAARAALRSPGSDRRSPLPLSVTFADDVDSNSEPELESKASDDSSDDSSTSASEDSSSSSGSESDDSSDESVNENSKIKHRPTSTLDRSAKQNLLMISNNRNGSAPKSALGDATHIRATSSVRESRTSGGVPFQGSTATKLRNQRRVESKRLAHMKKTGKLPVTATLEDLRAYSASNGRSSTDSPLQQNEGVPAPTSVSSDTTDTDLSKELERRRQKLLDDLASGGIDIQEDFGTAPEPSSADAESHGMQTQEPSSVIATTIAVGQSSSDAAGGRRRTILNVQSTNRMIFASLGLRTPKTAEERQLLQDKLQSSTTRSALEHVRDHTSSETAQQAPVASALWTRRISLSAVECCDEDVVLSAPPFPFQQRWDPQYQTKKKRKSNLYSESRSKKRKGNKSGYVESYDKYNTDGYGDALDYDDPEESAEDEYWEDGALLDGESGYGEDHEAQADSENSKFPPLPTDVSSLPLHAETVAKAGDVIVFTELACSAATNWQPRMVTRTALLHDKAGDDWSIQLAPRDLPPKKYDDDGNRVYEKFETMEDDEGDDDGRRTLGWAEMLEPRLLAHQAPSIMEP